MGYAITIILIGAFWHSIASIFSNSAENIYNPLFILSGVISAYFTSEFTIWSLKKWEGKEKLRYLLPTLFMGILIYWFFTKFVYNPTARDTYNALFCFIFFSFTFLGFIIIPFCYITRKIVWAQFSKEFREDH